jgi:hypothetical protein
MVDRSEQEIDQIYFFIVVSIVGASGVRKKVCPHILNSLYIFFPILLSPSPIQNIEAEELKMEY